MSIKIGILGATGRVSRLILEQLISGKYPSFDLIGASVRDGHALDGKDIASLFQKQDTGIFLTSDVEGLCRKADIVIDFTRPDATISHVVTAKRYNTDIVIGTTGLSPQQETTLKEAASTIGIVYAANTSIGVTLLAALVKQAASVLNAEDYDIEIVETHHKHKVDAPSGTALVLGHAAAEGRNVTLETDGIFTRHGHTGAREDGKIGFAVMRGGDVVGEHTVSFFGEGERLELTHKASDRALFAKGALKAATWLAQKEENGLYTMNDVLNL